MKQNKNASNKFSILYSRKKVSIVSIESDENTEREKQQPNLQKRLALDQCIHIFTSAAWVEANEQIDTVRRF